jgi:hypothetical protein
MPRVAGLMKKGTGALRMSRWSTPVRGFLHGVDQLGELGWVELTVHEHRNGEQAHETAFGIVHVEAIPEPLLCLATDLAFEALTVARRHKVRCEVVAQVLADCSALGQDDGFRE